MREEEFFDISVKTMRRLLVGIDLGTQSCRSIVFNEVGQMMAYAYKDYPLIHSKPTWIEQNPEDWWRAVSFTMREALRKEKIHPREIAGISIATQANTPTPVDDFGRPRRFAISWLDTRCKPQCSQMAEILSENRIYQITGQQLMSNFAAPKLMWIRKNEPEIFRNTKKFLLPEDFILYKLTGKFVTDLSLASFSLLFDIHKLKWSEEMLDMVGISSDLLPELHPSGTVIGEVGEGASKETGLKKGTPVVAGGHDQCCAAIGAGVVHPGYALCSTGTACAIMSIQNRPILDPGRRLICYVHAVPNRWILLGALSTAGIVLRWFRDEFCSVEVDMANKLGMDPYDILMRKAEAVEPGAEGVIVLPYFSGAFTPRMNDKARGVIFGLTLHHGKQHLVRALIEAVAFEIRCNLEVMEELGSSIKEIRLVGGAAKSPLWRQVKADVTGKPVLSPNIKEAGSLGAAILAGVGTGIYRDIDEGVRQAMTISERHEPREELYERYTCLYGIYNKVYDSLTEAYDMLAKQY